MTQNFPQKIAALEAELKRVRLERVQVQDEASLALQAQLQAREVSILRSLRWYRARLIQRPQRVRHKAIDKVQQAGW